MHRDLHPLPLSLNKTIGGGLSASYWPKCKSALVQGLVKRFFNEKEVTSTLVMDALFSGCKQVEEASRAGIGPKVCFAFSHHHLSKCIKHTSSDACLVLSCSYTCRWPCMHAAACVLHSQAPAAYSIWEVSRCHQACEATHSLHHYTRLSCLWGARQAVPLKLAVMLQRVLQMPPPMSAWGAPTLSTFNPLFCLAL